MDKTQLLSLEVTSYCNRGMEHRACPNLHPDRWANSASNVRTTDDQLVGIAAAMYSGGFRGVVAYHFYNEPLSAWGRIQNLNRRILDASPNAKFLLWTNGDYFSGIPRDEIAGVFQTIVVSNYAKSDLSPYRDLAPTFHELPGNLDWRLDPPVSAPTGSPGCVRPFLEMIVDYYGNIHSCCMDWRGDIRVGNIHDTPFEELWRRWSAMRDSVARTPMGQEAPHRCLVCGTRYTQLARYVPEVAQKTIEYLEELK